MSKMKDKLAASIKPTQGKIPASAEPATIPVPPEKALVPQSGTPQVETSDLNHPQRSLHPSRIWPD